MNGRLCSIDGCARPARTRGFCSLHYQRWWKHGDPLMDARRLNTGRPPNTPEALWANVQIGGPDDCWPWLGATRRRGYGCISIGGRDYITHRLAYQLATGEDPGELFVCHRCDNPPCCNPAHLFLGTPTDNVRDMLAKGRARPPRGNLTLDDVRAIRRALAAGESQVAVAERFGVGSPHVSRIARRLAWRDVA